MSYMVKCAVMTDFYLSELKPCSDLIIFVLSDDVYIPVSRKDFKKIMELKQTHTEESTNINQSFYRIPNEIYIDSSLENCFKNKNNTMKLELKGRFKVVSKPSERTFCYYTVTPLKRKDINSDEKSVFDYEYEISSDSEDEKSSVEKQDIKMLSNEEIKMQNPVSSTAEEKIFRDYIEEKFFENNTKCMKEYKNCILIDEKWFQNDKLHRDHDLPAVITCYENGNKKSDAWYNNGKQHRNVNKVNKTSEIKNLPAYIEYYENGVVKQEEWWQNNKKNRFNMIDEVKNYDNRYPCLISYFQNGNKKEEKWFQNDKLHRDDDLQADIIYYENGNKKMEMWFQNGKTNRNYDLPAVISYYENGNMKDQRWCKNGEFHRESDLPGIIQYYENGKILIERWCRFHKFYRENGLAPWIKYYENGIVHRGWYQNQDILSHN